VRPTLPGVGVALQLEAVEPSRDAGQRRLEERLNEHRYHDNWSQNLLISASLGGFRR